MAAYIIAEINVTDPVGYEEYRKLTTPTVATHGGKFVVRRVKLKFSKGLGCPSDWLCWSLKARRGPNSGGPRRSMALPKK